MHKLIILLIAVIFISCASPQKENPGSNEVKIGNDSTPITSSENGLFLEHLKLSALDGNPIQTSAYKDKILLLSSIFSVNRPGNQRS